MQLVLKIFDFSVMEKLGYLFHKVRVYWKPVVQLSGSVLVYYA